MNILLHHVVSDLDGQTGLRILDAMVAGERDPKELVKLRDERIKKSTPEEMEAALEGDWRPEHLFALRQSLNAYRFFQAQLDECDLHLKETMEQVIVEMNLSAAQAPQPEGDSRPTRKIKRKRVFGNAPKIDLSQHLRTLAGLDLTQTMGISTLSALVLISEVGIDMSRWRNEKAFAAWMGLAPDHKISGGRILSNRTRPVVNRAATILRLMALATGKTDTVLGHFYRRIRARAGAPKAITATARKLACLVYHLIKHKEPYIEPELANYLQRFEKQRLMNLARQARTLGYELVPAT
jgi:transposase